MKVILTCNVDDATWGVQECMDGLEGDDRIEALIELFNEDIGALLEDCTWEIVPDPAQTRQKDKALSAGEGREGMTLADLSKLLNDPAPPSGNNWMESDGKAGDVPERE